MLWLGGYLGLLLGQGNIALDIAKCDFFIVWLLELAIGGCFPPPSGDQCYSNHQKKQKAHEQASSHASDYASNERRI